MLRKLGAITPTGQWDYEAFTKNVSIQSIDKELRNVKRDNGWQDKESKEREEVYREANRPHTEMPTETISIVDQSAEDIEAQELLDRVRAKDPSLTGKELVKAIQEEKRIMIRNYENMGNKE